MKRSRIPPLLAMTFVMAACTGGGASDPPSTSAADDEGPGRLVVLGDGGNIVTMDPDGANQTEVTNDGETSQYFQPVWSPESQRLAWGEGDANGVAVGLADDDGSNRISIPVDGFPFYLNWAPGGRRLGILHNSVDGSIDFEIVDVVAETAGVTDTGSPYYFSWSPDGEGLVVHVEGERLQILDESGDPTDLGRVAPNFLAPQWTDLGILYMSERGLVLRSGEGQEKLIVDAEGFISIIPNAAGSRVALLVLSGEPQGLTVGLSTQEKVETNALSIVEVASGEIDVVSGDIPVGAFWSPSGERLLILSLNGERGLVDVTVWTDGEASPVDTLELSPAMINQVLPFLDQYAQSLQLWSPDSQSFALPGSRDGDSGIWVYANEGSEPDNVAEGDWVSWSGE